jgi:hypothetical protein
VRVVADRFDAEHVPQFQPDDGSILLEHRAQVAAAGKRAWRVSALAALDSRYRATCVTTGRRR